MIADRQTHRHVHHNTAITKCNTKKLKQGLVAFYDIRPGNRMDPFSESR